MALRSRARGDRVTPSGDHGSEYRVEVIGLGRQDWFSEPQSCFQERLPHLWHRSFSLSLRQGRSVLFLSHQEPTTTINERPRSTQRKIALRSAFSAALAAG